MIIKKTAYLLVIVIFTYSCNGEKIETTNMFDNEVFSDTVAITNFQDTITEEECYEFYDKVPEFEGGEQGLQKFILDNAEYPQTAIDDSIEGTVYIQFTINKDGSVSNPRIMRGVRYDLDEECKRVIDIMPKWKPAEHEGIPGDARYNLPFKFKLSSDIESVSPFVIRPQKENKEKSISLKVYPNPVTDIVNIELSEFQSDLDYQITNIKGQIVRNGQFNNVSEQIVVTDLESGLYIIYLISKYKGIVGTQKLIKK
jgi:TonB family protein